MMSRSMRPVSGNLRARPSRYHRRLDLRQVALQQLREAKVKGLTDDQIEDGVAEELHALVGVQSRLGDRGVGQRLLEELRVLERVAEYGLGAALQIASQNNSRDRRLLNDRNARSGCA